jgi:hypothetical protein
MTNFERIKGMSVEELAEILVQYDGEYEEYLVYGADTCCDSREKAVESQIRWLLRGVDK